MKIDIKRGDGICMETVSVSVLARMCRRVGHGWTLGQPALGPNALNPDP